MTHNLLIFVTGALLIVVTGALLIDATGALLIDGALARPPPARQMENKGLSNPCPYSIATVHRRPQKPKLAPNGSTPTGGTPRQVVTPDRW